MVVLDMIGREASSPVPADENFCSQSTMQEGEGRELTKGVRLCVTSSSEAGVEKGLDLLLDECGRAVHRQLQSNATATDNNG